MSGAQPHLRNVLLGLIARQWLQPLWRGLHRLALGGLGFLNGDPRWNGEERFLADLAARWRREDRRPLVIDAGANEGSFAAAVLRLAPEARIVCLEPNPPTFERLAARFRHEPRVSLIQAALAEIDGVVPLHDTQAEGSQHASLLAATFRAIHPGNASATMVPARSLDSLLMERGSPRVDLLKLDIEGAEKAALDGAVWSLARGRIAAIQLEMNAHNILSGLSLWALSERLPDFELFRILPDGLEPLVTAERRYNARDEVFKYSNVAALRRGNTAR